MSNDKRILQEMLDELWKNMPEDRKAEMVRIQENLKNQLDGAFERMQRDSATLASAQDVVGRLNRQHLQHSKYAIRPAAARASWHHRFDLAGWMSRIEPTPKYDHYSAEIVTGPHDMCMNEWLRQNLWDAIDFGHPVPMDVFVWAEGEAPERHMTKVAGLPYRPANIPWPELRHGEPMAFLGQICFGDSTDIVGNLPGDVLLLFLDRLDADFAYLVAEWYPREIVELGRTDDYPKPDWINLQPHYAELVRTNSYPHATLPGEPLFIDGLRIDCPELLMMYQATQIGSAPFQIHGSAPSEIRTAKGITSLFRSNAYS